MAYIKIELTQEMSEFLDKLVATGEYPGPEEALLEMIRAVMRAKKKEECDDHVAQPTDTGGDVTIQLRGYQVE